MKLTFALLFVSVLLVYQSCKKKSEGIDKELYDMAKETSGFVWFKNSSTLLGKSSGTGHSEAYLRTRYNGVAASHLDTDRRIKANTTFSEGSLIVKELYENTSTLKRFAILFKDSKNAAADSKGWVWGYIDADGKVAKSANDKGDGCSGCHSQDQHIDYMLMNKYFP